MSRRRVANPRRQRLLDAEKPWPHSVYRLFDADHNLLYIGVTEDVEHRVYMHLQTTTCREWQAIWSRYDHHDSIEYPDLAAAREAERRTIFEQAPILNRQHNPKRWHRVAGRYLPANHQQATDAA